MEFNHIDVYKRQGVIKIIIDAIVGAALYVIISIVLRIEELNEVLSMLKNKVAKGER